LNMFLFSSSEVITIDASAFLRFLVLDKSYCWDAPASS
jgi:hypothetical protein